MPTLANFQLRYPQLPEDRRRTDVRGNGGEYYKTMSAQPNTTNSSIRLASPVFNEGAQIPAAYTCKGQNINPPLSITGVPASSKSLALIMHDPDSVSGDFVHWLAWDLPASTTTIGPNSSPSDAVQGFNGRGQSGYTGPCPPAGTGVHRYIFELYALDKTLGLPPTTNRDQLQKAMAGHIIAQHTLTGLFPAD
ncbi:MAG: YbhB/YbcL family Raf kinase inhibitor-like protein [bacterium]|nr:YbhB/YbcL family Raf kinase inhibitor-like protein [bacterium]